MPKTEKKITRSKKLRKYATAYNSIIRNKQKSKKSPRCRRKTKKSPKRYIRKSKKKSSKKKIIKKSKKRVLNSYQKFVKKESKKEKYKNIPGKLRLSAIALEWKKTKNT